MAYQFNRHLFVEDGAAIHADEARSRSSASAFRAWRALDAERRLEAVEEALRAAANDDFDNLPLAL